jgi:hypothetical protein
MKLPTLIALTVFLSLWPAPCDAKSYDAVCDEMVNLAKLAAQAHNVGNTDEATAFAKKVKETYDDAVALDAVHPQAHLHYGTFLMNANDFEPAIKLFKDVLQSIGSDMRVRAMVMANIRKSEYGLYSMKRDASYNQGKGDLYEALEWGDKQLAVSPEPHRTNHEVATINAMLCEYDAKFCSAAGTKFRIATTSSMQHYTTFKSQQLQGDRKLFTQCSHSRLYVGSWAGHRVVATETVWDASSRLAAFPAEDASVISQAGNAYVHTFNAKTQIVGRDGIVTIAQPGDCSVFSPASDFYLNLADNILPKTAAASPNPNAPTHTVPVISLVQFAASSFYHWLGEAVPRLVLALEAKSLAGGSKKLRFLVPRMSPSTQFVGATFDLLFTDASAYELVEYVAGTTVQNELSYVTWDKQPCPPAVAESESANVPAGLRVCHALAHPYALNRARDAILAGVSRGSWGRVKQPSDVSLIVFASRGSGVTMRQIDEEALLVRLRSMLKVEASVIGRTELIVFDGSQSFEESMALFKRATVVVGVHGGALTNIIACAPNTTLVEIGFQADAAQHYQHMALSLGMTYRRVRVMPDANGRALGAPSVRYSADAAVDAVRHALGCWIDGARDAPQTSGMTVRVDPPAVGRLGWASAPTTRLRKTAEDEYEL